MSDHGSAWPGPIRGLLFDVDGTLYRQAPMRHRVYRELALVPLRQGPRAALRAWRGIRAFRRVRDTLRDPAQPIPNLADAQFERAAPQAGMPATELAELVQDWMLERPLPYLAAAKIEGIEVLLDLLEARDMRAGVFSDYPAKGKVGAMGLADRFDPILAATDPEISTLKPQPEGLLAACRLWGLEPEQVLYVGDRLDLDAPAAERAGMPCALIGAFEAATVPSHCRGFENHLELARALETALA